MILSALRYHVSNVLVDVSDELVAYRNIVAYAELVVNSLPWHSLLLLDECEHLVAFAGKLVLRDEILWFEQSAKHALLS